MLGVSAAKFCFPAEAALEVEAVAPKSSSQPPKSHYEPMMKIYTVCWSQLSDMPLTITYKNMVFDGVSPCTLQGTRGGGRFPVYCEKHAAARHNMQHRMRNTG